MHFHWVLNAARAVMQQRPLPFDFQSPRGSLAAGEGVIQAADGAHAPVPGISEGRRESVSFSPSKPAPDFPFLAQGVSTRCSRKSMRLTAPRGTAHSAPTPPRLDGVLSDRKEPTPFRHLPEAGALAASQGFPLWPLLLTQTLEGPAILAVGPALLEELV